MALSMKNSPELTTEEVLPFLIQPLESQSIILREIPRTNVHDSPTGDPLRIPKFIDRGDEPAYHTENQAIAETDPEFDELTLLPSNLKSIKVLHRFSNELARHSVVSIANTMQTSLVRQVADKFDREFLNGTGTNDASGNRGIIGLVSQADTQEGGGLQFTSATSFIDSAIDAIALLRTAEINDLSNTVLFVSPGDYTSLQKLKGSDGRPLLVPDVQSANVFRVQGVKVVASSRIGSYPTLVDFNQVVIGRDLSPSVKLLDQTFANYDQLAIRVTARMDIGLLHPEGVVRLSG